MTKRKNPVPQGNQERSSEDLISEAKYWGKRGEHKEARKLEDKALNLFLFL